MIKAQQNAQRTAHSAKGVSLIIVIFAMMLLSVLGWSLAVLLSTDFEMSLRQIDSERALYLAEAGTQWAMNQLSQDTGWRTDGQADGGDGEDHTLTPGEYNVICCTPGEGDCPSEDVDVIIISTGYIPFQADYRAMRQVKVRINHGLFDNVTSGANLFDWHFTGGYYVDVDGDLQSPGFEGDDADSLVYPGDDSTLDDLEIPGDGTRTVVPTTLPDIDMGYFENYAKTVKGSVFDEDTTFDEKDNLNNKGVYYVKGNVIIDLSKGDIIANHTSIIAEGDIEIKGTNSLSMKAYVDTSAHETLPNLATENGDIISSDTPDGLGDKQKRNAREFDGLIFTQYGDVDFNYINGVSVMGVNVRLRGSIELEYRSKYVDSEGFIGGDIEVTTWQEQ